MLYQQAKKLLPQSKLMEISTKDIYVVEKIEVSNHPMKVRIYAREEKSRKPRCFDHMKVKKIRLFDEIDH